MKLNHPAIAVDIGGTRIKIALLDEGGVRRFSVIPSRSEGKLQDRLPDIETEIRSLTALSDTPVLGIGISLPCLVNPYQKRATEIYSKFEDAPQLDLEKWCRERFSLPMVLEQDSKAALVGETAYGCAKGCENAVMIIMGTGVGTAVMLDGKLLNGKYFSAGSIGSHMIIDAFNGRKCTCPGSGCLEAYTGSWALPGLVREHPQFESSILSRQQTIDFRALEDAVKQKDPVALDVFQTVISAMRAGLIGMIHAYSPEIVILSGGPLNMGPLFTDPLLNGLNELLWGSCKNVRFVTAQNPDQSVLLGLYSRIMDKAE